MNLDEIENLRASANVIAEKLTPKPSSILKVEFEKFYREIIIEWEKAIVDAYKQGQLKRVETENRTKKESP